MLVKFFFLLRKTGVPVSITELLTLLEALKAGLGDLSAERFYYLARTCLVKDEKFYDRYDRAFAAHFKGVEDVFALLQRQLPADWLEKLTVRDFTDEEKAEIEAMGGWEKLMETLKKRLEEQKERHQGGNKWIGTAGTSPYGAYGFNPEGVRIGQEGGRNRSAVKVWDKREFANLDDKVELGTRNIKIALRRLRRFARRGVPDELALADTIDATARSGGWLDIKMQAERKNVIKILLLLGYRRIDGRSRQDLRGIILRRAQRVQASRALLLSQLRVRSAVEGQSAALQRARRHHRNHPHLRSGLQADSRGRCDHESL